MTRRRRGRDSDRALVDASAANGAATEGAVASDDYFNVNCGRCGRPLRMRIDEVRGLRTIDCEGCAEALAAGARQWEPEPTPAPPALRKVSHSIVTQPSAEAPKSQAAPSPRRGRSSVPPTRWRR